MQLRKVLLVYKKSSYETHVLDEQDKNYIRLLAEKSAVLLRSKLSHEEHVGTLETIQQELTRRKIPFDVRHRKELEPVRGYDLVLTIGGDGTFLEASHFMEKGLLMGVNSSPDHSVGHFCRATADNFSRRLNDLLHDRLHIRSLSRLQVRINDDPPLPPVLNDVLFTNLNPAGTTRYVLKLRNREEEQKSSGLWIATAAGSTAAIHSAGGRLLPIGSRQFQYVVREPYLARGQRCRLRRGLLQPRQKLQIITVMDDSALYLDGPHATYPIRRGDEVTVTLSRHPLKVIG